jgi:hypothetical protein
MITTEWAWEGIARAGRALILAPPQLFVILFFSSTSFARVFLFVFEGYLCRVRLMPGVGGVFFRQW